MIRHIRCISLLLRNAGFFTLITVGLMNCASAVGGFTKTAEIPLTSSGNHHGIAFDGTQWHIASAVSNAFNNYDSSFNYINSTNVSGFGDLRGLTYDSNSNHLFVGDSTGVVRETTIAGTTVQQFNVSNIAGLNGLAYDLTDNSIWLAYFNNSVEHRNRTGSLLSSFSVPGTPWTGIAVDTFKQTLLLMETGDSIYEYKKDGTLLSQIITTDQIANNGQGLAYNPNLGRLYATSQFPGIVTIFDDPIRAIPEPSSIAFLICGAGVLAWKLRRKKS